MSELTYAPPLVVPGPLPAAPRFNLFSVATQLAAEATADGGESARWAGGISVLAYPPGVPAGHDPCSAGTFRTKEDGDEIPTPVFAAFTAYLPIICSALGIGSWEEFTRRANTALDAVDHFAAERQLAAGQYLETNPHVLDLDADLLNSGNAVGPAEGLELLEKAIADTARQGVIHATPDVVAAWSHAGHGFTVRNGRLETVNGTPVVSGQGYLGASDARVQPDLGDAPTDDQAWAFATGPVFYRRGDLIATPDTLAEALDREDNTVVYRAERDLLVGWDTALQAAVLIDRTA